MMIKTFITVFLFLLASSIVLAQNKYTDSFKVQLANAREDSSRVLIMSEICYFYRYSNIDSSFFYGEAALSLAKKIKFRRGETNVLNMLGLSYREKGDLPKSLELQFKALKMAEDNNYLLEKSGCLKRIGLVYMDLKDFPKAIGYYLQSLKIDELIHNKRGVAIGYMNLGMTYQYLNNADSALYYNQKAFEEVSYIEDLSSEVYRVRGDIEAIKGHKYEALHFYQQGIERCLKFNDFRTMSFIYSNMAALYNQMNQPDSSIYYASRGVEYGQKTSYKRGILLSANLLSQLYDSINPREALRYYKIADATKDSLFGAGNFQTIHNLVSKEEARQYEIEQAKLDYQSQLKQYGLIAGLGVFSIIALILFRNNRQKQKANKVLETTLTDLKATQAQLIQSEKMASLGELTAGIAHEIQNPLNFVNNFSELNKELADELEQEIENGNYTDAKGIAKDIKSNEEKINHHGKRADAIVKGMLQHSRSSSGVKESTDINALTDEYFRLAYHGLRAKDNSFNAILKTELDENIGRINIIPQDIGRVILNLFTNAFYAVNEKKSPSDEKYEPTVSVSTKKINDKVEIRIKDNANGIPQKVLDKIFQPFFTTKPTGQGTGLGLSLAYDIVKAHGGELKVNTTEGEGSEFIIQLPVV